MAQQQQIFTLEQVPQFLIELGEKINRMEKVLAIVTDGGLTKDIFNIDEAAAMLSLAKQTLYCNSSKKMSMIQSLFRKRVISCIIPVRN